MPITIIPPQTVSAAQAEALTNLGRALEGYTSTVEKGDDNEDTYVTVLDIAGRGVFNLLGAKSVGATAGVIVKLTLDGVVVINEVSLIQMDTDVNITQTISFNLGFDTSCLLEMKMGAPGVVNVEFIWGASVE